MISLRDAGFGALITLVMGGMAWVVLVGWPSYRSQVDRSSAVGSEGDRVAPRAPVGVYRDLVENVNPVPVTGGARTFAAGDACRVEDPIEPIGAAGERVLYRVLGDPRAAVGFRCPAGVLFFETRAEVERSIRVARERAERRAADRRAVEAILTGKEDK